MHLGTSENCLDFSNDLSSDFFDPFHGQMFGQFALPAYEGLVGVLDQSEMVWMDLDDFSDPPELGREMPPYLETMFHTLTRL